MKIRDRLPLGVLSLAALVLIGLLCVRAARSPAAAVRPSPPALHPATSGQVARPLDPPPRAREERGATRPRVLRLHEARGHASQGAPSVIEVSFDGPIDPTPPPPDGPAAGSAPPRLEDFFSVWPPAAFRARVDGQTVALEGAFEPGCRYRIAARRGLRGAGGAVLPADAAREVRIPDLVPSLAFPGALILPPRGRPTIPLEVVNVDALGARAVKLPPEDLARLWTSAGPAAAPGGAETHVHPLTPAPNRARSLGLRLDDLAGPDPRGAWRIQAFGRSGGKSLFAEEIAIVSDIAITLIVHEGGVIAWTSSMSDGAPLSGVDVALIARTGERIAEGRTGEHGLAFLGRPPGPDAVLVLARKGPDVSLLEIDGRHGASAVEGEGPREAFVFTDLAACAPGETLRVHAWIRALHGGLPPGSRIEITAIRPDGEALRGVESELGGGGAAEASIAIPSTAPAGPWRVEARGSRSGESPRLLGAAGFSVEGPSMLRDVEIGLGLQAERARALRPGQELEVVAKGITAGGLAASGTRSVARWSIAPRAAPLAEWREYSFGEAGAWDGSWGPEEVEALLDARGEARLRIAVPELESALPLEIRVSASDRPGHALERDLLLVPIDPAPAYLGLRLEDDPIRSGPRSARFECVAVRPDGRLADLEAVDLQLMRVRWREAPRRSAGRSIRYESRDEVEEVGRRRVALSGGRGGFEVDLEEDGFHRVRIKDPASPAAAELTVHAGSSARGFTVTPIEGPGRLELAFRKAAVRPGEKTILRVVSPFAGSLLLLTETDRIEAASVKTIDAGSQDIEVHIPERPRGPVRLAALAAGGPAGAGSIPRRAFARIRAPLEPGALRLAVTVSGPPSAPPGSRVRARATVASEEGKPVAGAIVALGLLDPTARRRGARPPDPAAFFHDGAGACFRLEDAVSLDVSVGGPLDPAWTHPGQIGAPHGGREPRAAPLGPYLTGDDGTVVVEIETPESAGEALLFAIASAGPVTGAGDRPIQLRAPLPIRATWPDLLAAGDSFELPVEVVDVAASGEGVTFRWSLDGLVEAPIAGEGGIRFTAHREAGPGSSPAETAFGLRSRWRSGAASATLFARRGDQEASISARIPVRARTAGEHRWETGVIDASHSLERTPRQGALPGSLSWRLLVSSDPLVDLAPSLHALLEREPLTLEEWTSRALSFLHLGAIAGAVAGRDGVEATRGEVLAAVEAILGLRSPGGLLASTPGGPVRRTPATLAATLFLAEARAAGHAVPGDALEGLLDAISASVLGAPSWSRAEDALDRARALHALAVAGRADGEALDSLRLRLSLSELEASGADVIAAGAHLAAAHAASGRSPEALALLEHSVLPAVAGPDAGPREAATALIALARAGALEDHEGITRLVEMLLDARAAGRWRTLEETALALSAIGRHAAVARRVPRWMAPAPGSDFRAEVRRGSGPAAAIDPGSLGVFAGEWPDGPVRATASGAGALRYAWLEQWARAEVVGPGATAGIHVARRILDRRLEPVDPAVVRRGDLVVVEIALRVEAAGAGARTAPARAVVTDRPAGGLEVEDLAPGELASQESLPLARAVLRRGEAVFVLSLEHATAGVHRYAARAVLRGDFGMGPISASLLEEPGIQGVSAPDTLRIR